MALLSREYKLHHTNILQTSQTQTLSIFVIRNLRKNSNLRRFSTLSVVKLKMRYSPIQRHASRLRRAVRTRLFVTSVSAVLCSRRSHGPTAEPNTIQQENFLDLSFVFYQTVIQFLYVDMAQTQGLATYLIDSISIHSHTQSQLIQPWFQYFSK